MELLASNVLGTNTTTVSFTSIPQTYKHLILRCNTDGTNSAYATSFSLSPNSTATIRSLQLYGSDSSDASQFSSSGFMAYFIHGTNTAYLYSLNEIYIYDYTSTSRKKRITGWTCTPNSASTEWCVSVAKTLYNSTSAITSLDIIANTAFKDGSSFYLYGTP